MASVMESSSSEPNPSSINSASIRIPLFCAIVDIPIDRASEVRNFSPPDNVLTNRPSCSSLFLSYTFSSSPLLLLPCAFSSDLNNRYLPPCTMESIRLAAAITEENKMPSTYLCSPVPASPRSFLANARSCSASSSFSSSPSPASASFSAFCDSLRIVSDNTAVSFA